MSATRNRTAAAARRWAKMATLGQAHAATKEKDTALTFSASSRKGHTGEASEQCAADRGLVDWAADWGASPKDVAEGILGAIGAMEEVERLHPEYKMSPIEGQDLRHGASSFKWLAGVGIDGARLRHLIQASEATLRALAVLLNCIEKLGRWPEVVRQVLANAIPKKAGGSRLIGIASLVYRLWARVRYGQCQAILEARIERPYLDAAPGRGAARAAFTAAFRAEAAVAQGQVAATTLVDASRFFMNPWIP